MKLFKSLLIAPATLGLISPISASANEINFTDLSKYSSSREVKNIREFNPPKQISVDKSNLKSFKSIPDKFEAGSFSSTTAMSGSASFVIGAIDNDEVYNATETGAVHRVESSLGRPSVVPEQEGGAERPRRELRALGRLRGRLHRRAEQRLEPRARERRRGLDARRDLGRRARARQPRRRRVHRGRAPRRRAARGGPRDGREPAARDVARARGMAPRRRDAAGRRRLRFGAAQWLLHDEGGRARRARRVARGPLSRSSPCL